MKRELGLLLALFVVAGCGGKGNSCVPGMSAACVCSDGSGGAQVCGGDGTYAACDCGGAGNVGGNGGDDMAMGGGGSGGGGSGGGGGTSTGSKRVFVTSTLYAGSVVKSVCGNAADAVGLGGTWLPWLSESEAGAESDAIATIQGSGPWVRLDGMVAFANHAQLATTPSVPINVTEKMQVVGATEDDAVWTGTLSGGVHGTDDCFGWTSSGNLGSYGHASETSRWTASGTSDSCSSGTHRVYCFEQ